MTGLSAVTLFSLYIEHIMRNAGLDELQAGIKIGGRNINNLRYEEKIPKPWVLRILIKEHNI